MRGDLVKTWRDLISIAESDRLDPMTGPETIGLAMGFVDGLLETPGKWLLRPTIEKQRIVSRLRVNALLGESDVPRAPGP